MRGYEITPQRQQRHCIFTRLTSQMNSGNWNEITEFNVFSRRIDFTRWNYMFSSPQENKHTTLKTNEFMIVSLLSIQRGVHQRISTKTISFNSFWTNKFATSYLFSKLWMQNFSWKIWSLGCHPLLRCDFVTSLFSVSINHVRNGLHVSRRCHVTVLVRLKETIERSAQWLVQIKGGSAH